MALGGGAVCVGSAMTTELSAGPAAWTGAAGGRPAGAIRPGSLVPELRV